jgi:hypothetical protein
LIADSILIIFDVIFISANSSYSLNKNLLIILIHKISYIKIIHIIFISFLKAEPCLFGQDSQVYLILLISSSFSAKFAS